MLEEVFPLPFQQHCNNAGVCMLKQCFTDFQTYGRCYVLYSIMHADMAGHLRKEPSAHTIFGMWCVKGSGAMSLSSGKPVSHWFAFIHLFLFGLI